jgi:hypothetical protein
LCRVPKKTREVKGPADPQQDRLYAWEETWRDWERNTATLAECRAAIRKACASYYVKKPLVVQHGGNHLSWSKPGIISLRANRHKNFAIALHEAAHQITDTLYRNRGHAHGPTFVAIYLKLLVDFRVAPASAIYASAHAAGLKWRKS